MRKLADYSLPRDFSREPAFFSRSLRCLTALLIRAFLRVYHRFEIVGQEHLRLNGSFVLVANHCSHLDALCLLSALPLRKLHRTYSAAAEDYFFKNHVSLWLARAVTNALPFARQSHIRQSLAACDELLSTTGRVLIIFPEGTRSTNGRIHEFKPGIGALASGRNIKVVPCYLQGTFEAWPKGQRLPRPRKVRLIIGKPRDYLLPFRERDSSSAIAADLEGEVRKLRKRFEPNEYSRR